MRLRTIAVNTFGLFLRDRLLIIFGVVFLCVVLLMTTPLLFMKSQRTASNMLNMQAYVLQTVSMMMSMVSGAGSLLAAWAAADGLVSEMKSGTILAVMARPVKRWEFLLGKYLGVLLLMAFYVVMMFLVSLLLAWMGGQKIAVATWPLLLLYPMVRYAIYAAIAMAIGTLLHPIFTWAVTLLLGVLAAMVVPRDPRVTNPLRWVESGLYYLLPSTHFLSEDRFLDIKHASLRQASWFEHLTTLAYGMDYAAVVLLVAIWSFHYRSLKRD